MHVQTQPLSRSDQGLDLNRPISQHPNGLCEILHRNQAVQAGAPVPGRREGWRVREDREPSVVGLRPEARSGDWEGSAGHYGLAELERLIPRERIAP